MIEIKGKSNIVAKIICDSVSEQGIRLITYELTYPRLIHSEIMTHGMLVRNAASSRAIPFNKMAEQLTARPVRFGQANPGMQDKGEDYEMQVDILCEDESGEYWLSCDPYAAWCIAKDNAINISKAFYDAGYHKQVYNRLTEPFQMMKTVLSGTELENFFWLRNHGAADPTLAELARCMHEARVQSVPDVLKAGEYHLPYVLTTREDNEYMRQEFWADNEDGVCLTTEQAIKVSCARTAAVSFRNEDYGLEKCLEVYARLIGDDRKHASAMQHQATPMKDNELSKKSTLIAEYNDPMFPKTWEEGISHVDRDGQLWSAQFKGWIMWRKCIAGENYIGNSNNKLKEM